LPVELLSGELEQLLEHGLLRVVHLGRRRDSGLGPMSRAALSTPAELELLLSVAGRGNVEA
jgi:hypothetical protein